MRVFFYKIHKDQILCEFCGQTPTKFYNICTVCSKNICIQCIVNLQPSNILNKHFLCSIQCKNIYKIIPR